MRFSNETQARSGLACRARTSRAPAVVLVVCDDATFRLIEADAEGRVLLRSTEELHEYRWTEHRGTVEDITLVNSYCVALISHAAFENHRQFTVPHGTDNLEPAVRKAIEEARDDPSWKRTYATQPITAEGLRESAFVDGGIYDLPIPDALSEDRHKPTSLVELTSSGQVHARPVILSTISFRTF